MARVLFQAEIEEDLAARVGGVKAKFRLTNVEAMRVALEMLCDHLEKQPDPFEVRPTARANGARK